MVGQKLHTGLQVEVDKPELGREAAMTAEAKAHQTLNSPSLRPASPPASSLEACPSGDDQIHPGLRREHAILLSPRVPPHDGVSFGWLVDKWLRVQIWKVSNPVPTGGPPVPTPWAPHQLRMRTWC